jgi:hypothetical protein
MTLGIHARKPLTTLCLLTAKCAWVLWTRIAVETRTLGSPEGAAAGLPGMLELHFRCTAVRNLERSGVSRPVATKISGHRTEAVYRYAIMGDQDLRGAAAKLAGAHFGARWPIGLDRRAASS